MRFQTNSARLFALAVEAFARFGPPTREEPLLRMRLFTHPAPMATPGTMWPVVTRTDEEYAYVTWGPVSTLMADLQRGFLFGYLGPDSLQWPHIVMEHFLIAPVLRVLLWHDYFPLRSAILLWRRRFPIYLVPGGDLDLSPLLYHAVRHGWRLVSAREVRAVRTARGFHFWGVPWWLSLPCDVAGQFPELTLDRAVPCPDGVWRVVLDVEDVWPGSTEPHAGPGPLVLISREGWESAYRPVNADKLLEEVNTLNVYQPAWVQERMTEVASFLAAQGSYRMTLTEGWTSALEVLAELADQHWRG